MNERQGNVEITFKNEMEEEDVGYILRKWVGSRDLSEERVLTEQLQAKNVTSEGNGEAKGPELECTEHMQRKSKQPLIPTAANRAAEA